MDTHGNVVDRAQSGEVDEAGAGVERPVEWVLGRPSHLAPPEQPATGDPAGGLDVLGEADEVVGGAECGPAQHERAAALHPPNDALPFQ